MKVITTICGDIPLEQLGLTSMHDHIIFHYDEATIEKIQASAINQGLDGRPPLEDSEFNIKPENMYYVRNNYMCFPELFIHHKDDNPYMIRELRAFRTVGAVLLLKLPLAIFAVTSEIYNSCL